MLHSATSAVGNWSADAHTNIALREHTSRCSNASVRTIIYIVLVHAQHEAYIILCYIYYIILCYVMLCYIMLCYVMLYYII